MDRADFVFIDQKAYRKGYTTGSCATAAAKVAAMMALTQKQITQVCITTPSGVMLDLEVCEPFIEPHAATAAIRKDGGDDVDVTHGMLIYARVVLNQSGCIQIEGGDGIGRVTRKGIRHELGSAAINEVPRKTIEAVVREVIGADRGANVLIFAPEGAARARQTFNPRLGIKGGISILGTTGIVTPMSDESWKSSISLEIQMKRAEGLDKLILVPGNYGERFAEQMGMDDRYVVIMSNFVRHTLKEAEQLGFKKILLLGHLGKLIKVAAGIFHTHSHIADGRIETLIATLALMGAPRDLLMQIDECKTTEAAMELIDGAGLTEVYSHIALRVKQRAEQLSVYSNLPLQVEVIVCALDGRILGSSALLMELIEEYRA